MRIKKEKYELSIIIPCYNEVKSLPLLIQEYKKVRGKINFQLIIVDNGSTDGTWGFLQKRTENFIKSIRIKKNVGYGNGIHMGLKTSDAEIIGWSHGDLQCSPKDIFKGYRILKKSDGKVLVKGNRTGRDWKSLILTYGLALISTIILLRKFDDINGQPKIFRKSLIEKIKNYPKRFSYDLFIQYIALKNNYKITSFPVKFEARKFGFSKWAFSIYSRISTIKGFIGDIFRMRVGILK